jgi:hypothetical protein
MQTQRFRMTFALYPNLECLPSSCRELFLGEEELCLSSEWFRNMIANGLPSNVEARFGVLTAGHTILAVLPLQYCGDYGYGSLTNCYSCIYRPLISMNARAPDVAWSLGHELGRLNARWAFSRLDCMPSDWSARQAFSEGLRCAGLEVRRFDHFGNWYEEIHGRSWEQYLASRPGHLRELIRRRKRQTDRAAGLRCEIIRRDEELSRGLDAFERVYARSWKPSEPFPRFNIGVAREAAHIGALRLGVCWQRDMPIAVQLWVVRGGVATVLKLAHDESSRGLSPGTVLTAAMIEALIYEGITSVDFGRGDDSYKRLWVSQRRQRVGLMLANPRRIKGIARLARHDLGRLLGPIRHRNNDYVA